ncbi:response regulator [Ulvibacter litoralis]|uniref:DNA-binding response regulator, NarL/FixJ family, contains REC and HTH domains n=1 Tax=Ulvibacter litoralis TaxID=227084 RepID=A0A1G7CW13_9FLAO|nr:response regulator transcription factor [Ulvibacter litoralis]GHC45827.1 DNA-binding response regulator [Ulvibacter litoralis]SDE43542.1 DNA-binding response regulator, NarL/FixJ family, contains REC and HTH domains [Ulvibacter litoralis]
MIEKKKVSILIADDHPILLKGLNDELIENGYWVINSVSNGMKALEEILTNEPTLALLDIDMPLLTGFEVIKKAKEKGVTTKFIVLSFHKETSYIAQAKTLQIEGYLLKEDSFLEIEKCMESVLNNRVYFSSSFRNSIVNEASEEVKKLSLLTPSEVTILKLAALQKKNNEIAESLCVSTRTIEKHRSNIIVKLNLEKGSNSLINWVISNRNVILEL